MGLGFNRMQHLWDDLLLRAGAESAVARRGARLSLLGDLFRFEGIIRVRHLPEEWSEADYAHWWLPPVETHTMRALGPARMSEREKDRYTEYEARNMLMVAGRAQALAYLGSASGNSTAFAKYLAVGTGVLMYPTPIDTQLVTETARKALSAYTVQGTQVDCNFAFASGDSQVAITEAGLFGGAASGTANSGTLCTHALFQYTKGAYSVSMDYLMNLF